MEEKGAKVMATTNTIAAGDRTATEAARDQRSFIEQLKQTGDVVVVDQPVHWDLELGAISRRATETDGPAVLFTNITDYPGQSIFANPISTWRRAALTLGLPAHAKISEIYAEYTRRDASPIPPIVVTDAASRDA